MLQPIEFCLNAQASWGAPGGGMGCSGTAVIGMQHLHLAERLATAAKEAILSCTQRDGRVCLLGCRKRPFTSNHMGFVATLASPPADSEHMCRNIYDNGYCKYGKKNCYWQHPESTATFAFVMALAGPQLPVYAPQPRQPQKPQ